jgi:hypothetical protein
VRHSSESLLLMVYLPCQYTRHDYDCQFLQLYDLLARIASYFHGLLKDQLELWNSDGVTFMVEELFLDSFSFLFFSC